MRYPLGRFQSPLDPRDYRASAFIPTAYNTTGAREWDYVGSSLNQQQTNRCTGFAGAGWGICNPVQDDFTDADGDRIYRLCKIEDGNPDGEEGSTMRSLAKALKKTGMIKTYAFAYTIDEVVWWILNRGPVLLGTDWTASMFSPDGNNVIHPTGEVIGGHAYFTRKKSTDDFCTIRSSWGDGWGINGEALISMDDLSILLHHGGEAIVCMEEEIPVIQTPKIDGCSALLFKLFGVKQ
jgi:hypothetical protein